VIMCKNKNCDYPVCEKETKTWLKDAMNQVQEFFKEKTGTKQEWVDSVYKRVIKNEIPKKMCFVCAVRFFMSVLVFEKLETLDPFILEWVLVFVSKIAIIQHTEAVLDDLGKKIKTSRDCGTFLLWLTMRLRDWSINNLKT
jgi:hypothetical protein